MFKFSTLSGVTALVALILFTILLVAPQLIFLLFAVEGNDAAYFISRRAAMLFLGIALIAYTSRNAVHSTSRQAICLGLGSAMLALFVLGAFELFRGFVGVGILPALVTELAIGSSYLAIWFSNRHKST